MIKLYTQKPVTPETVYKPVKRVLTLQEPGDDDEIYVSEYKKLISSKSCEQTDPKSPKIVPRKLYGNPDLFTLTPIQTQMFSNVNVRI